MKFLVRILVVALGVAFALGCERPSKTTSPSLQAESAQERADPAARSTPSSEGASATSGREVVILAGGCFWGMEDILRDIDGVIDTEVGYAGGTLSKPSYEDVKKGTTGHAESVRIVFDPSRLSFSDLLSKWFFRMHDPTTRDRQGNDVGSQYRSAIFYSTEAQRRVAEDVIKNVGASGQWDAPIVTEVRRATEFTPAEDYHQDYLEKNPGGYTCHYLREPVY